MPRNVRNFWIELQVDGATKRIETGPRAKDGGFQMVIKMRNNGSISKPIEIVGSVSPSGHLQLVATHIGADEDWIFWTQR